MCDRFLGLSETCACGEFTLPPAFDPEAAIDAVVAALLSPEYLGASRRGELAALLTRARVVMGDDGR